MEEQLIRKIKGGLMGIKMKTKQPQLPTRQVASIKPVAFKANHYTGKKPMTAIKASLVVFGD